MCSILDCKGSQLSTPQYRPYRDIYYPICHIRQPILSVFFKPKVLFLIFHPSLPPTQSSYTLVAPNLGYDFFSVTLPRLNTLLIEAFSPSFTVDLQLVRCDLSPSHRRAPTSMASSVAHGGTPSKSPSGTATTAQEKTDTVSTSPLAATALREAINSGSDCTPGVRPTGLVSACSLAFSVEMVM